MSAEGSVELLADRDGTGSVNSKHWAFNIIDCRARETNKVFVYELTLL